MRQSTRGTHTDLLIDLFRSQIRVIYEDARSAGQRLVLRDHAHSHFCTGPRVQARPNLVETLPPEIPVLSVMTVRHPLDSFGALRRHGWSHFEPFELDEYCLRYLAFLDSYPSVPLVRYEEFSARPLEVMRRVCDHLALPFEEHFQELFNVFTLTGDSGRSGDTIEPRARLADSLELEAEARNLPRYLTLTTRLGYTDHQAN
jgi:hypothetical protein